MNFYQKHKARLLQKKSSITTKLIQNKKTAKAQQAKRKPSGLSAVVLMHNGGMVYELSFIGRLLHFLYNLGFSVEYLLVKIFRNIGIFAKIAGDFFAEMLGNFFGRFVGLIRYAMREFNAPFATVIRAVSTISDIFTKEKHYGSTHMRIRLIGYIRTGIKKHLHLTSNPFCYILPAAALVVFIYTATTIFNYDYVLQVSNNNLALGYIENAKTMDSARMVVNERIQYQGSETTWEVKPSYNISVAQALPTDIETQDISTLANNLILSSGEDIQESTGLFVDGEFYGATQDRIQLENDINGLLNTYQRSRDDSTISFVQEVEMVDGLFLQSSIVEHNQLQGLINSTTGETIEEYTVAEGDTATNIAANFSITTGELISLNPDVDFDELEEGSTLNVKRENTFLTVKEVQQIVYEEVIEYETEQKSAANKPMGTVSTLVEGVDGLNVITADVVYIDGVQTSIDIVSTEVVTEPVTEVIEIGTALGSGGINYEGPALGSGAMIWPTGPGTGGVSRGFTGVRAHNGIDIWGAIGTPIYAVDSGVVVLVEYGSYGYGIQVMVDHGNGIRTRYAHNSSLNVQLGDTVVQGQQIAGMGSTGNSTGSHLHFEVILNGTTVDPGPYIGYY